MARKEATLARDVRENRRRRVTNAWRKTKFFIRKRKGTLSSAGESKPMPVQPCGYIDFRPWCTRIPGTSVQASIRGGKVVQRGRRRASGPTDFIPDRSSGPCSAVRHGIDWHGLSKRECTDTVLAVALNLQGAAFNGPCSRQRLQKTAQKQGVDVKEA